MSELMKPKQFKEKFDSEFQTYNIILDEIQKVYPEYRLNEKNVNYSNELSRAHGNLSQSHSRLFSLKNNLENNTKTLREENDKRIDKINALDLEIEKLEERLNNLLNSNNAAKFAIKDFRFSYIEKLIYNIILGILIFSVIFINYNKSNKTLK